MTEQSALVVRKRIFHRQNLWWVGRGARKDFVPYYDIYAPTGYGYHRKALAERMAATIEQRLAGIAETIEVLADPEQVQAIKQVEREEGQGRPWREVKKELGW